MFKSRKIGFSLAVVLGLMMTAPVMADEACNQAVNNINKATATLTSLQQLRDQISQRQTALASGGASADAPYKCPACGMMMPTSPTGNLTKAVKYGGKTYYCCKGCDMSATADK
ncbi:MAG TPA: hypothetical protein VKU00_26540 [Chthonomonadaceae bacterium]|nr:hypothetical protein [Chthonomonadaceae bacterium]